MSDEAVPAIKPSLPEEQPLIPQPLVELHGWGRASGTMSHLAQIDSVADAVSALRRSDNRGVVPTATPPRTLEALHSISPR